MKKNIWIMNHYANDMYRNKGGRHYWFAENLLKKGYNPVVFCASTFHNSTEKVHTGSDKHIIKKQDNIPFVFIKTISYNKNNYRRVLNMLSFYKNMISVAQDYALEFGRPDIIIASSVHPLTLKAGLKIAQKFEVPCIIEIRDLWPESLVAYEIIDKNNLITKLLYLFEKKIYKKSDSVIMTWEGGKKYIFDKGWNKSINLKKVHHISNGIDLEGFDKNSDNNFYRDEDLEDNRFKNIVYTGSIRKVNNLGLILDTAKIIYKSNNKIRFLIYGSGDEQKALEERCKNEKINNVIFKGRVDKRYVPSILKRSYANLLHNSSTSLDKYGQSQNKLFEYLASGKPVIQTYTTGFSVLDRFNCGVSVSIQRPEDIAKVIIDLCEDEEKIINQGTNAREASEQFDFKVLTNKLISIIEKI